MQGLADVIRVVNSLKCDIGYVKRKLKEIIDSGAGQPGADGREIELQSTSTELQWRYVGDATWQTLATFAQIGAGLPFVGLTGNEDVNGVKTFKDQTNFTGNFVGGQVALGGINQSGNIVFKRGSDGASLGQIGYTSATTDGDFAINSGGTNGQVAIMTNGQRNLQVFATGNVKIQKGGTFVDEGVGFDVVGTGRYSDTLTLAIGNSASPPLQFRSGPLNTVPIAGAVEFLTDKWYGTITTGTARKEFAILDTPLTITRIPYTQADGRLTSNGNFLFTATGGGKLSIGTTAQTSNLNVGATAQTSGNNPLVTFTGAAHTNQTASTELFDINFAIGRTVQFANGNLTTQRAIVVGTPTYSFVGPGTSTITTAASFYISGAPIAGPNAAITTSYALQINSGASLFNGISFFNDTYATGQASFGSTNQSARVLFRDGLGAVGGVIGFSSATANGLFQIRASADLSLVNNGIENLRVFNSGNVLIQNGGTYVDAGYRLDVTGTARLNGVVQSSNINPLTTGANDLGSASLTWRAVFSRVTISDATAQFGTNATGSAIQFRQGTNVQIIGGFAATTGNVIFQSSASTLTADNGAGLQLAHTINAASAIGRAVTVLSTINATANNDVLIGVDINPTFNNGAFTGVTQGHFRVQGDSYMQNIYPRFTDSYTLGRIGSQWNIVYSGAFQSLGAAYLGSGASTNGVYFRLGTTTSTLVGGFYATTGNAFFQASGAFGADTGDRVQVYGSQYLAGNLVFDGNATRTIGTSTNRVQVLYTTIIDANGTLRFKAGTGNSFVFSQVSDATTLAMIVGATGNLILQNPGGIPTDDTINKIQCGGSVKATQFRQAGNLAAPASATAAGVAGEIRFDNGFLYYAPAANTWLRAALVTWP